MKRKTIIIVGSEGFIGRNLVFSLNKNYNCISVDIKKIKKKNYFFCNLRKRNDFKKLLHKLNIKNKLFAAINATYPYKSLNFLQNNLKYFLYNINTHLLLIIILIKNYLNFFLNQNKKKSL